MIPDPAKIDPIGPAEGFDPKTGDFRLTASESTRFLSHLDSPPEPIEKLRRAAERYNAAFARPRT